MNPLWWVLIVPAAVVAYALVCAFIIHFVANATRGRDI